jgi:hypothetical protein
VLVPLLFEPELITIGRLPLLLKEMDLLISEALAKGD